MSTDNYTISILKNDYSNILLKNSNGEILSSNDPKKYYGYFHGDEISFDNGKVKLISRQLPDNIPGILIENNYGEGTMHVHPEQDNNNYLKLSSGEMILLPGLQNSLMIGLSDSDKDYYISNITIGFLEDIGYIINDNIKLEFPGMENPF